VVVIFLGAELKVQKIFSSIEDIMSIIRNLQLDTKLMEKFEDKYSSIVTDYNSFIDNYLDFREIADNLSDGIYISSGDGTTLFTNEAYLKSTGIQKNDIIGRNVGDIEKEGKLFKGSVTMDVIRLKKPVNSIAKIINSNKDVLVSGKPIFDEQGNVKLVVINNRDITKLKELENKISNLQKKGEISSEELKFLRNRQISHNNDTFIDRKTKDIMDFIHKVAPTDTTILITGESGTGKEVIADKIYNYSKRKDKPFIKINCSAIPPEIVESELFGYEGGAFTDANKNGKIGLFELAKDGTILLDEIGDMPLSIQSKILRALQQREIIRVGGKKVISINIRVIACTNKDLKKEVQEKRFREDLYYRLNVVPIYVPPLRERTEDLKYLIYEFLNRNNKKYGKNIMLSGGAFQILLSYQWPGNIRELENFIERIVILSSSAIINKDDISTLLGIEKSKYFSDILQENINLKAAVQKLEKEMIISAIKKYGSSRKAAEHLGIDQSTIVKKCKKIGVTLANINEDFINDEYFHQ
jgi:PAS domain S-box-containing protein